MPGRRGRGTCLASPGAKRDAATRHPSAGGRPGARARNHEREPELDIIISNASDKPIYDQIVSQMKALILTGELGEGQQLPSIRALAGDLRISVITTKRAYDELEREGFIYTVAGKGCFVAQKNVEMLREENLKKIEGLMQQIAVLAASCNLTEKELIQMFQLLYREE